MRDKIVLSILGREFISDFEQGKDDLIMKALKMAFTEIDELKEKNKVLNDKINSVRKVK